MSVSTRLYATQMPKWHSVIQSELTRSLILSGTPQALLTLTPSPESTHLQLQSDAAQSSTMDQEGSRGSANGISSLMLADGKVNWQGAKTASAQSYPVLLHQALTLALTADWGPADFGACETDSSDSSKSSGSEQADDSAAQEAIAAAGHEKILAIAVMAVTLCCDKPTLLKADGSRATLSGLVAAPANEVSLVIAPACFWKADIIACMLTSHVQPSFSVTKALKTCLRDLHMYPYLWAEHMQLTWWVHPSALRSLQMLAKPARDPTKLAAYSKPVEQGTYVKPTFTSLASTADAHCP